MPRTLVFGNGLMLVQIDDRGNIRDLCAPRVGQYNHLNGAAIRLGLWVEDKFSWLDSDEWSREQSLGPDRAGLSYFECPRLEVRVVLDESIEEAARVFHRDVRVHDLSGRSREVRLFQTHDLRIAQTDIGDTALYSPQLGGLVHFKENHWFHFTCTDLWQWECGYKSWKQFVGTWCDAEDGWLGGKPIEQGSVDSTLSARTVIPAGGSHAFCLSIRYAESFDGLRALDQEGRPSPFGTRLSTQQPFPKSVLHEDDARSLMVILSQCDAGGAILAANDSDIMETNRAGYNYCWPRDGAHVASIMLRAGFPDVAQRFLEFCEKLITPERPYFFQKYNSDGSWGASWHPWVIEGEPEMPMQEDETALVVSLCYEFGDPRFIESIGKPCAAFLARFVDENGLPRPSYDLWEERRGIHCNTTAKVIEALRASGYASEAERMHEAWSEHAWDADNHRYARMLTPVAHGYTRDMTMDSAMLAYAVLCPNDERWRHTVDQLDHALRVQSPVGGYARYEHDYYFRQTDAYPGNPWIITSLWFGLYDLACANHSTLEKAIQWTRERMTETGMLAEQYHPETGAPLSVMPLTWSHAEFVGALLALRG